MSDPRDENTHGDPGDTGPDDLTKMTDALRGIKAPRGQGNGYNMPGGKKKLAARIRDAKSRKGAAE